MNEGTESSSDNADEATSQSQPSQKRKWYRKRARDPHFRKPEESDNSSDSSGISDASQEIPRRRKKLAEKHVSSHSDDEEENNVHGDIHSDDTTSQEHESTGSDGERNGREGEMSNGDNQRSATSDQTSYSNEENDGESNGADENSGIESNGDNNSDQDVPGNELQVDAAGDAQGKVGRAEDGGSAESELDTTESDGNSEDRASNSNSEEEEGSEEGEGSESEDENMDHDDNPIFDGASITLGESALVILTFILTHKLTGLCVTDLLSLLALHCGPNNILLKTLYKFKKYFKIIGKDFIKLHHYCSNCEKLLPRKNAICCENRQVDTYFIEFPIVKQLRNLFARPGFYEELQYRFTRIKKNANNVEEIYNGAIYQQLFNSGFLNNPNHISFFMYFDGVAIFKSSKFSIWPAYLTINELKYKLRTRKENTVLAGLWFGRNKPNPNLFLKPIHDALIFLGTHGTDLTLPNGEIINVKAKLLGAVADMPAKSLFMRFIQYNGAFSCFICMAQGGRFDLGNATIQVFPYSRNIELRNNDDVVDFASQAVAVREHNPDASVYGIKGPSLLSSLLPNMILCMGIDIMHGVFLGVMKTVMNLWFDGLYSTSPFSISNLAHIVDARLTKIKPPSSFQNVTRRIKKDMATWKAFDFKVFFFYYSLVVLCGILPERYWLHHVQLVASISILCQESISPADFGSAEAMLHSYVSEFQELYGVRHMTLTFHQLLHLPLVCKNLGPAWVFSCFFYESLNGELARLVHGSRHVALQICSSSAVYLRLPIMISTMDQTDAKALCLKFQKRLAQKVKVTENIDNQTGVVGKMKNCYPVPEPFRRLLRDGFNIFGGRYKYFYRLKRKGLVYTSQSYLRSMQKKSYFVEIFYDNVPYLCKVNHFIQWSSCRNNCPLDCALCPKRYFCVVSLYDRLIWELHDAPLNNVVPHLNKVAPKDEIRAYPVESIRSMCIYMPVDEKEYIALPVNNLEVE